MIPVSEFTTSNGADRKTGSRDSTQFHVTVRATADAAFADAPETLTFRMHRAAGNSTWTLAVTREEGVSPARYEFEWPVTTEKGKWEISVEGYASNTVTLKINKREQIVLVARSWIGATRLQLGHPLANCNDLTSKVYGHLGLGSLPSGVTPQEGGVNAQHAQATAACAGDGCLLFYSNVIVLTGHWTHVAVQDGSQRININSNTTPVEPVVSEGKNAGVGSGANVPYKSQIEELSTINLDED